MINQELICVNHVIASVIRPVLCVYPSEASNGLNSPALNAVSVSIRNCGTAIQLWITATAYRETASGPPAERFWRARQRVAAGRGSRVSAHCLRGPSSHTAVAPCAAAGNPWGGISWTGDGDTLFGKCLRSSHHPEAVHLHLNTYPSESGAAPLLVGSGLMFWPSSRWPGCKHESCRRRVLPAATGLHVVVSGVWQVVLT